MNDIVSGQLNQSQNMANRTDNSIRCLISKKTNDGMIFVVAIFAGLVIGFLVGISFPTMSLTKINFTSSILPSVNHTLHVEDEKVKKSFNSTNVAFQKIWVPSNPRGAEMLPPTIVRAESDFYLRRLWGLPKDDLPAVKPKYLVAFTVAYAQRNNIDACIKKFSDNFTIVLFHYDGKTSEYDEFEWSKRAIHVSVPKQTKWWYAKRFLHPDIVAPYDYIFIWDEDLGVENFDAEEYIKIVKKHGLEISQPAVESPKSITWKITQNSRSRSSQRSQRETGPLQ